MAPKAMKRAASKSAGGASKKLQKLCKTIAPTIKHAESLPKPVRSLISDRLVLVFGTYQEDRHALQKNVSDLVGKTLRLKHDDLQKATAEAEADKAAQDAEGAKLAGVSKEKNGELDAAGQAADAAKQAFADCTAAHRASKAALHTLEKEVEAGNADLSTANGKKQKLESMDKEFFTVVKEGTLNKGLAKSASWAAKQLGNQFGAVLEPEFIVCVEKTFATPSSEWRTFDHIVDAELTKNIQKISTSLATEIATLEAATEPRAARLEAAKADVGEKDGAEKAAEEAFNAATYATQDAKKASKAAVALVTQHQKSHIDKAAHSLQAAEDAMAAFKSGPMAAFAEAEAHTAPPPAPEPEEPTAPPAEAPTAVDEAMTAAPAERRPSPSIMPSPGVLFMQAARAVGERVGLATSPRVAQSPAVAASPGR